MHFGWPSGHENSSIMMWLWYLLNYEPRVGYFGLVNRIIKAGSFFKRIYINIMQKAQYNKKIPIPTV